MTNLFYKYIKLKLFSDFFNIWSKSDVRYTGFARSCVSLLNTDWDKISAMIDSLDADNSDMLMTVWSRVMFIFMMM